MKNRKNPTNNIVFYGTMLISVLMLFPFFFSSLFSDDGVGSKMLQAVIVTGIEVVASPKEKEYKYVNSITSSEEVEKSENSDSRVASNNQALNLDEVTNRVNERTDILRNSDLKKLGVIEWDFERKTTLKNNLANNLKKYDWELIWQADYDYVIKGYFKEERTIEGMAYLIAKTLMAEQANIAAYTCDEAKILVLSTKPVNTDGCNKKFPKS